jgi:hypothetical protein
MKYFLTARCPVDGETVKNVVHESKALNQARQAVLSCPHHKDEKMEVVEVADPKGKILWQDRAWLEEKEE